jgi:flagellar biosynthesis protein FliR
VIDFDPIARIGLVLARPSMLVATAPPFGGTYAPMQVRIGIAALLAFVLFPVVEVPAIGSSVGLSVVIARELAIGMAIGFAIRALVGGAELAGYLTGLQIGFSYSAIVDPQSGVRNNLFAILYGNLALVTFFGINGHHALIQAVAASYAMLPIGVGAVDESIAAGATRMLGIVFVLGVRVALPVMIVLLVVELAIGLISRAAPNLNLMALGMPLRVIVGLLVVAAVVPSVPGVIGRFSTTAVELGVSVALAFR